MQTIAMTHGLPSLSEPPACRATAEKVVSLLKQRQAAEAALQGLQRTCGESTKFPQAFSAQIQATQRHVASYDMAFALLAGGFPI